MSTETIIYVDVDGVLNVAVEDVGGQPILLEKSNCEFARSVRDPGALRGPSKRQSVERLKSVLQRPAGGGVGTYAGLVCDGELQCSDVLVGRLAEIIQAAAGPRRSVVLSSSWRHPKHARAVAELEMQVARHLGESFAFDGATDLVHEGSAAERLQCIGEHLRRSAQRPARSGALRAVVLDDLGLTPLDGWLAEPRGAAMCSTSDIEAFLRRCARAADPQLDVGVRMVHCYAQWRTRTGLPVRIGAGLPADAAEAVRRLVDGGGDGAMPAPGCAGKTMMCRAGAACCAKAYVGKLGRTLMAL